MEELFSPPNLAALAALTGLEIVLGIDNLVFIAILVQRLEASSQGRARLIGLSLAMIMRIILLLCVSWVMSLTKPLFVLFAVEFSGKSLILLAGGLFLLWKSTLEIHRTMEKEHSDLTASKKNASFGGVILQIMVIDAVFSLDSVITAVGVADNIPVMIIAIVISMIVMLIFAKSISVFIERHPTLKMLALSFLMLVGVMLVADGCGVHVTRGYIYFAMAFSFIVEMLNMRARRDSRRA